MAIESDPFIWKILSAALGVISGVFIYFIKKRDDKIDENTKELNKVQNTVTELKAHYEMSAVEQSEMKETLKGVNSCLNDIRIHLAGLPCTKSSSCGMSDRRINHDN